MHPKNHVTRISWHLPIQGSTLVRDFIEDRLSFADAHAAWYRRKKRFSQSLSKSLRILSLIFVVSGGIFPVIAQMENLLPVQAGYVLLALSGACLLFDRVLGISTGWARYMTAALELEALAEAFRAEALLIEVKNDETAHLALMELCRQFTENVNRVVLSETTKWVHDFSSGREELGRMTPLLAGMTERKKG